MTPGASHHLRATRLLLIIVGVLSVGVYTFYAASEHLLTVLLTSLLVAVFTGWLYHVCYEITRLPWL